MSTSLPARMRRRYASLGCGELVAAAVFAGVAWWLLAPRLEATAGVRALWCALVPLLLILVQGGIYWLLAPAWAGRRPMPQRVAMLYRVFRLVDVVVLAGGLAAVLIWAPRSIAVTALVAVVWLFGAIEYLNYFVIRLAYPPRSWLADIARRRPPRLLHDLRRSAPRPTVPRPQNVHQDPGSSGTFQDSDMN